ncbi:MAG TPA: glycogen/starch synthase [Anaerolineales bacterium]|nr:glycogen/starch synthase [Anaerolineales bacterium]
MPESLNVLFLAAEAQPFIKVGGLGDVAGSLPRFILNLPQEAATGIPVDVRLVLPMHPVLKNDPRGLRPLQIFPLSHEQSDQQVQVYTASLDGLPVYFLDGEAVASSGSVYSLDPALDAEKYTFFSMAALELTRQLDWKPSIVHANDWHTALACYALLLKRWEGEFGGVSSVLTVHNLPFMGPDVGDIIAEYGLMQVQTGLPEWANTKPLPLGLWAADAIVAVSPTYAREILTPKFGCGLEDYLHARKDSLNGILNGIDNESFNPALDPAIAANFGIPTLERRPINKQALQVRLGLPIEPETPLLGVISRMDPQKGIDLIPSALRRVTDLKWQAVILGTGQPRLEQAMRRFQAEFPDRVRTEFRYDDGLARQIYAGADMFLMPSRYEPCGLSQMIAMRYGCVPIVSAVGGLKDTIFPDETGFMIEKPTAVRLATAVRKAIQVYPDRPAWEAMQKAGMSQDFSWSVSARQYLQLYQRVVAQMSPR